VLADRVAVVTGASRGIGRVVAQQLAQLGASVIVNYKTQAEAATRVVAEIVAGIKALQPDMVIPMHCSGVNFVAAAHAMMPEQLVLSTTGSKFTLGA